MASFGINSVSASKEDEDMIKQMQKSAVMRDPTMAAATLVGAQADAMRAAASNSAGAMNGFMGVNMAANAGGMNAQNLFAMGQQQAGTSGLTISAAAELFRALGDENRLRILELLKDRELCAGELLKSLSIVQSTLSHHMKILVESGLVICRKQGKWSYYSISPERGAQLNRLLERWLQDSGS